MSLPCSPFRLSACPGTLHVACQKSGRFWGRPARDPSVPDEAARICINQAAFDFVQHQCHCSFIELPNESRAIVRSFCSIRREQDTWKRRTDCSPCRVSTIKFVPEIQQLL